MLRNSIIYLIFFINLLVVSYISLQSTQLSFKTESCNLLVWVPSWMYFWEIEISMVSSRTWVKDNCLSFKNCVSCVPHSWLCLLYLCSFLGNAAVCWQVSWWLLLILHFNSFLRFLTGFVWLFWFGLMWVFVMCHLGKGKIKFTEMLSDWGSLFNLFFSAFLKK